MNPSREANEKKCPTEEYILYWRNTTQTPIPIKGSLTFQLLGHKLGMSTYTKEIFSICPQRKRTDISSIDA
jgi:hypothetical protein